MNKKIIQQAFDKPAHLTDMKPGRARREQFQLLLTHEQLVDWLIYHVPMEEGGDDDKPFIVEYHSRWHYRSFGSTPLEAYEDLAGKLMFDRVSHRKITDLYWYWTI